MTFDEFVGARLSALLRYATVVTCDPYLAEDVVQDVLVRAQLRWGRIGRVEQPEAYVKRMVLNEFLLPIGGWRLPAKINGIDGGVSPEEGQIPQVLWPVAAGLNLAVMVSGVGDDTGVALSMARSVEADGAAGVESPLDFGWLPNSISGEQQVSITRSGDAWAASLGVYRNRMQIVSCELGRAIEPPTDGSPVVVRGRPGFVRTYDSSGGQVYIELDNGLRLLASMASEMGPGVPDHGAPDVAVSVTPIRSPVTRDDLLRAVEELRVGRSPTRGGSGGVERVGGAEPCWHRRRIGWRACRPPTSCRSPSASSTSCSRPTQALPAVPATTVTTTGCRTYR